MTIYELIDNAESKQYEFHIEGKKAVMEYIKVKDKIYLTHTELPAAFAGKGIGSALVKAVLEEVKRNDWTLVPLCPFVAMYIKKHPEYRALVLKGINIGD